MRSSVETLQKELAQLDAETRHAEAALAHMRTKGADHFRELHRDELKTLPPEELDDWSAREWARRQVEDAACS